jgi:two-component system OmpR family sensor kinase
VIVRGDADRLYQVMANLLANVRVHTPPNTPVDVKVAQQGSQVVITVTDHGPGLSPEALERVFERFYRADKARARASGGTGLGLSIVAAIVQSHGGEVGVSSTPGEGATFTVTLPVYTEAATSDDVDLASLPEPSPYLGTMLPPAPAPS